MEARGVRVTKRCGYVSATKVVSVKLPVTIIDQVDQLISKGYFQNRSDVIREAIRRLVASYQGYSSGMMDNRFFLGYR